MNNEKENLLQQSTSRLSRMRSALWKGDKPLWSMALRSEKARFEKNVRQEHEADYISVLSVPLCGK